MTRECYHLNEMSMDEVQELEDIDDKVLFFPIGISEGHGSHLPVGTDTFQGEYITEKVAEKVDDISIIAPTLNYGHCRATSSLPGSMSISFDSLRNTIEDILTSGVEMGFERIVMISGHAGSSHMMALRLAAEKVVDEEEAIIMVLSDYDFAYDFKGEDVPDTDGHGGEIETSRVLDIRPDLVEKEERNRPKEEVSYPRFLIIDDHSKYLTNGMRGDATRATKEDGKKINEYVIENITKEIEENFDNK